MANEMRLIDANLLAKDLELLAKHEDSFRKSVILGVVRTIKAQPTVDADPVVHGRWEDHFIEHYAWGRCSNCGVVQYARTRYCPNCGAKMDGGHEYD